jgi:hypothetical protein
MATAGVHTMKRIRLAALCAAFLPGMLAGCSSLGNGPIMSRMRGNHPDCACEMPGGGPCCDGPALGEGMAGGPMLPPTMQPVVPPYAPPLRPIDPSGPSPAPASTQSRIK